MKANSAGREAVTAFLEANPASGMGQIQAAVLAQGISSEQGVQAIMRSLVRAGAVVVTDSHDRRKYRYTLNEDTRTVKITQANRFEVPAELAGGRLDPMAWSMRYLLGASA